MANLFFPQLSSGAFAQYPIRKTYSVRTVKNVLTDGTMLLNSDPNGARTLWELEYVELNAQDIAALQAHFANCTGIYRAFTFIDPTGNMLAFSSDLTQPVWDAPASLVINGNQPDPIGGNGAFSITNNAQAAQSISQTLPVLAGNQYCFSFYASSAQGAAITVTASGASAALSQTFTAGATWNRFALSTQLIDPGQSFTISIALGAGQRANLFGPQLEPQLAPSRYRSTYAQGGVYVNAHWATSQLAVIATAPGLFATSFTVETSV